tara:strand:+ start:1915 stop:2313 length:399 start_codon:yes stop_codon:yes gene_type:complete
MKDLVIKHKKGLRSFALRLQTEVVEYWENKHDPELKHNTGRSTYERAEEAREKLKNMETDLLPDVTKEFFANYLRKEAIEARRTANDFPGNPWIKWGQLRRVIELLKDLKTLIPDLEIYSNHWLSLPKKISL